LPLSEEERKKWGADVGFVGTFEEDRAEKMLFLAENGIKVRIWGNGWKRWIGKHPNLLVEGRPVYGLDYIKVLNATKINLCFLRKANRDLQTDRTMEIPACGAFMLAERTEEHLRLFEEGKEAEFFDVDNPKELLEKVKYYLTHEEERKKIAKAGRERCLKSGYSHHDRLKYMMEVLSEGDR
jgi:spore maturation protein CgeB